MPYFPPRAMIPNWSAMTKNYHNFHLVTLVNEDGRLCVPILAPVPNHKLQPFGLRCEHVYLYSSELFMELRLSSGPGPNYWLMCGLLATSVLVCRRKASAGTLQICWRIPRIKRQIQPAPSHFWTSYLRCPAYCPSTSHTIPTHTSFVT